MLEDTKYDNEYKIFTHEYNKLNFNEIPKDTKILILSDYFNEELNKESLPKKLEVLIFGKNYNQKIKVGVLPKTLKVLIFGDKFNQIFHKNTLPKNLKILELGSKYEEIINIETIPSNLEMLYMNNDINMEILTQIVNLKKIKLSSYELNTIKYINHISKTLKNLEFLDLKFDCVSNHCLDTEFPHLKILKIDERSYSYSDNLEKCTPNLKYLEIYDNNVNQFINVKFFPNKLAYLELNSNYIEPGYNPKIGYNYYVNYSSDSSGDEEYNVGLEIDSELDEQIEKEIFGRKIENLKYLSLDGIKEQKYLLDNLPLGLETIKFNRMNYKVTNLPYSLKDIYLKREKDIKYIPKIPFGCNVHIDNFDSYTLIIDGYIVNNSYYDITNRDNIEKSMLNLDSIGCQYYALPKVFIH